MEFVESLGADVVLPLTDGWAQAVRDAHRRSRCRRRRRSGRWGGLDDAIRVLATEGRLLVLGFASGGGIPTVKVNRLLLRNVSVVGVGFGEFIDRTPGAQVGDRRRTRQARRGGAAAAATRALPAVGGTGGAGEPGRRRHARERSCSNREIAHSRWPSTSSERSSTGAAASSVNLRCSAKSWRGRGLGGLRR